MADLIIADDEMTIRQGLKKLISEFNLDINCAGLAADGQEALMLAEKIRPQLMLVDINMPRMNGLELIEKVHAVIPEGKIIIVSGYDKFDFVRQALRLGVFDYLLKPINHGALYVTLQDALNALERQQDYPHQLEEEDVIQAVIQEISRRYADKDLRLATLAEEFYVSPTVLSRGIKDYTGQTFSNYLTDLRMQKAIELIDSSKSIMIYTLADQVGCSSQHYFCKLFKDYTGFTPSEYIRFRKKL